MSTLVEIDWSKPIQGRSLLLYVNNTWYPAEFIRKQINKDTEYSYLVVIKFNDIKTNELLEMIYQLDKYGRTSGNNHSIIQNIPEFIIDYDEILLLKMQKNDAGASTIGEYLYKLLYTVWSEGESFSGKRPFGNSDWEEELHETLMIHGYIESPDQGKRNDIIDAAIKHVFKKYIL